MNVFRNKTFFSSLVFVGAIASAYGLSACSDDDDNNNNNDGGDNTGGTGGKGGSSSTGGKGGTGGSGTGGSVAGGGPGTGGTTVDTDGGTGGAVTTPDGGGPDSGQPGPNESGFRLVHAAPGAPNVDVYVKGKTSAIAKNIAYGDATGYVTVEAGTYQFEVRQAGAAASSTPAFTTPNISVGGGKKYTAIAEGNLNSSEPADRFRVSALEEDFGANAAGKTRVRLVHAVYDGPTVGVDIGNDDGAAPEIAAIDRFADSDAAGLVVDSGKALQVGIIVNKLPLTAFTTPSLPDGKNVFVVAAGVASKFARDPLGIQALVVNPDSSTTFIKQNPRIYAVHASPDAGSVDVFSGNVEVVDNVNFGSMSLVQVPPGAVKLDFFPGVAGKTARPSGDPAGTGTTPALEAGNSYLAVAAGTVTGATKTFSLITAAEGFDGGSATESRLRAVHASGDAPAIDLSTVTTPGTLKTPPLFTNAKYKDVTAAAGAAAPVSTLTLGIAPTGTTATAAEFAVTTTANERAFVIAAGAFVGTTNPLQLLVVNTSGVFWAISSSPKIAAP